MAENLRPYVKNSDKTHSSVDSFKRLLDILDERQIRSTLFIVGKLLKEKKYVKLMRSALKSGHEVASHSMNHKMMNNLSLAETTREVTESLSIIEDELGVTARGFRSPCFSSNQYLENVLLENDILYTSNGITASLHDRYGRPSKNNKLIDVPIPYFSILFLKFPITGGGWFRILPVWWQLLFLEKKESFMFYCHPWDFDVFQPHVENVPFFKNFRHNIMVSKSEKKILKFLSGKFKYITAMEFIENNLIGNN